jgi:hypothetical protein
MTADNPAHVSADDGTPPGAASPDDECWVYLSQHLPAPLNDRVRCRGNYKTVSATVADAWRMRTLAALTIVLGPAATYTGDVNPMHVLFVGPSA